MADPTKMPEDKFIQRPVEFYGVENVVPIYSDMAALRHTSSSFQLMFFTVILPVTEDQEVLKRMPNVPAKCIARIVMSPEAMARLYEAIGTNVAKWQASLKETIERGEELEA